MMMTHSLQRPNLKCLRLMITRPLTGSSLTGEAPPGILTQRRYGVFQKHKIYVMIWRTGEPGWARPGVEMLPFTSNW